MQQLSDRLTTLGLVFQILSVLGLVYAWVATTRNYVRVQRTNRVLLIEKAELLDQVSYLKARCDNQEKVLATATRIVEVRTKEAIAARGVTEDPPTLPPHRKRKKNPPEHRKVRDRL